MSRRYKLDPAFVVPDPTPADIFHHHDMPQTRETFDALVESERKSLWQAGVTQWRVSFFVNGDGGAYPDGVWIEGWKDPYARQLPFGTGWPTAESAVWPPLADHFAGGGKPIAPSNTLVGE